MAEPPKVETTKSEITKTTGAPPKKPDPSIRIIKKKVKKKGPKPILEVAMGVVLFISVVAISTSKVNKLKETGDMNGYYTQEESSSVQKSSSKINNIDLDNFSELEREYIINNCKKVSGENRTKCIAKSINELMDLY